MSDITPEKVAAAACEDVGGWQESLEAALSVTAQGDVLSLEVTRWAEDGTETVRHYRAPVVEGTDTPIVLEPPAELGISWHDGGDLLSFKDGIIRLNPRGVDEWDLSPQEALELAGQLAAMAVLAARADDLEDVAFGGTTPVAQDGGAA